MREQTRWLTAERAPGRWILHVRFAERRASDVLIRLRLFLNRTANLGPGTQLVQWLTMQGAFFVISEYLQEIKHDNAIQTGSMLTPAIVGTLVTSAAADRLARRHSQRALIIAGFAAASSAWASCWG